MNLVVQPCPVGARLIDCVTPITLASAHALKAAGIDGVIRYGGSLSPGEFQDCMDAGLGVMLVGFSRADGWVPSDALGAQDGAAAVAHAHSAGLLTGTTVWCDVEGCGGGAAEVIAYCETWWTAVHNGGFVPGVYVGAGNLLTAAQLQALPFTAYWRSLSNVETPSAGWQMFQLYPSLSVAGIWTDIDVTQMDYVHRQPHWTIAALSTIPLPFVHDTEPPAAA